MAYEDHAGRALAAAAEMVECMARMNRRWVEKDEPPMNIGIGIRDF